MNPTPNQITECTDERQLCEWAARYCQSNDLAIRDNGIYIDVLGDDGYIRVIPYQPTSPTEKGKAQCWDLAVSHHCWPRLRNGKYVVFVDDKTEVEHEDPQIAVVKAAIIVALNGEEL